MTLEGRLQSKNNISMIFKLNGKWNKYRSNGPLNLSLKRFEDETKPKLRLRAKFIAYIKVFQKKSDSVCLQMQ